MLLAAISSLLAQSLKKQAKQREDPLTYSCVMIYNFFTVLISVFFGTLLFSLALKPII